MKRWGDRLSLICGLVASVFLTGMLLLTVVDVGLRSLLDYPLRGVYELVLEKGWLAQHELDRILTPENLTQPRPPVRK